MPKHMIEIDIPEGYEFLKIDIPKKGDFILERIGSRKATEAHLNFIEEKYIILQQTWSPPDFLKPGWIAMCSSGFWVWYKQEPILGHHTWVGSADSYALAHVIFNKPHCSSWQESKRRVQ